jgi:Fe-S-cluster-containing dehydrogenase component/DMSO reductase anchor subunit
MRKGFIFNHNRCVACNACSAACILENGWTFHAREILTYNNEVYPELPVINLSLSCNHCELAVCLEGCPSSSYTRDVNTGAILIDDKKCIGCKYCQWNCPYDAPKFDTGKRIIGKCNLCYSRLQEGLLPSCSTACPTGALSFGEIMGEEMENAHSWFPDKRLNPAIEFTGKADRIPLRIFPEKLTVCGDPCDAIEKQKGLTTEWSLMLFSFFSTLSVATLISSFIKGIIPNKILLISMILVSGAISLFHLGKQNRAWRAISNWHKSPLSREIALFILYSVASVISLFLIIPGLLITACIIGLILLVAIDSVYLFADKRSSLFFHSGQTFLSGLFIVSMLSGAKVPFLFIATLKLTTIVYSLFVNKSRNEYVIRYIRLGLLLVVCARLISEASFSDHVIISLFLAGEFLDRLLFYLDFKPVNINRLINRQFNEDKHEKERG